MSDLLLKATFVPGAPDGLVSEADLAIINRTTARPFLPEQLFCFACVMLTPGLTDYCIYIGESTRRNVVKDAAAGIPYLLGHRGEGGIYGYTYAGQYDEATQESRAAVFIVRGRHPDGHEGKSSNQEIADIAGGLRREVSMGLGGPYCEYVCDLCHNDVFSLDCQHIPGMRFNGTLATATMQNARGIELSGVFRGACPGAIIGKAEEMHAQFSAKELSAWCEKMCVPNPSKLLSVPTNTTPPASLPALPAPASQPTQLAQQADPSQRKETTMKTLSDAQRARIRQLAAQGNVPSGRLWNGDDAPVLATETDSASLPAPTPTATALSEQQKQRIHKLVLKRSEGERKRMEAMQRLPGERAA